MKKLRNVVGLIFLICNSVPLFATIFEVGENKTYQNPNALYQANLVSDGDTILIDGGNYLGEASLAVWDKNDLYLKGVNGRPHLQAQGEFIWGKGTWVLAGNNILVDNIEFSGARVPDQNGAGIRLDGEGMTALNCYFHDNENGILTNNAEQSIVTIRYCEFGYNGFGDGQSHNIYVNRVAHFIFEYNYSHHANVGHCVKSRAYRNTIQYNRLMDEETGNSSRLIDLSNGGKTIIMGNEMMQGPNAENKNLVGYGLEGLHEIDSNYLFVINNTLINKRVTGLFLDINIGFNKMIIANNLFGGVGDLGFTEDDGINGNIHEVDLSSLGLADEMNFDYSLINSSIAVDGGVEVFFENEQIIPEWRYEHIAARGERIISNGIIDVGADELSVSVPVEEITDKVEINIYPNPASDYIFLPEELINERFKIINYNGVVFQNGIVDKSIIDIGGLIGGIYYLIVDKDKVARFVKR